MNEVRASQVQGFTAVKAASAKPADARSPGATPEGRASEKAIEATRTDAGNTVAADVALNDVVSQMNEFIQREQRDLSFSVDETTGTTVIRVMDRDSGDVIRQIPEEVFLRLAREAKEREAIQLINVQS